MDDEYNSLVRQKRDAQRDYYACQNRIDEYDYLLRRLKSAKQVIDAKKKEFKALKKEDKNIIESRYNWKGDNYDSFIRKGEYMLQEDETFYKGTLDHILDSLNNEITRIENARLNDYGLLGRLGSLINSLANKIENFFN